MPSSTHAYIPHSIPITIQPVGINAFEYEDIWELVLISFPK